MSAAMRMHPVLQGAVRGVSRLHTHLLRWVGGKGFLARNVLILTTRGRKTGRERSIPLLYIRDAERLYIVASFGGNDDAPGWYKNLCVHPEVTVEVDGTQGPYRCRTLSPEETKQYWPRLVAMYSPYESYQKKTSRVIPVVELTPA